MRRVPFVFFPLVARSSMNLKFPIFTNQHTAGSRRTNQTPQQGTKGKQPKVCKNAKTQMQNAKVRSLIRKPTPGLKRAVYFALKSNQRRPFLFLALGTVMTNFPEPSIIPRASPELIYSARRYSITVFLNLNNFKMGGLRLAEFFKKHLTFYC